MAKYKFRSSPVVGTGTQSFTLTSTSTGTFPFTVGIVFAKGDVTAGPVLTGTVNYQSVVKRLWNDGSIKHAICSGRVALTANTAKTISASNGTAATGTALTAASIVTAAPSASVQCGALGTVTLASLLATPSRTWISGAEMVECHYRSAVGADATLQVWFHVRLYADGRVWVRASVENGYLDVTPADKSYVPTVIIGGVTVYNNSGVALSHYGYTRWTAEGWIGGDPAITPQHDSTYLMSTKLVPNYWKLSPSASALNALYQTYAPNQSGNWTPSMSDTGYQFQIALLPGWDALYVTSGDARAYRSVIAHSKALGSYPIFWSDSTTFEPVIPTNRPTWTVQGAGGGGATAIGTAGGLNWDVAHHGSGGYLAYLITGDYFHLETMQHQCSINYLVCAASSGSGTARILRGQTRATAWAQRTIGQLVGIAPLDATTLDWRDCLSNQAIYWKTQVDLPSQNLLGYIYTGEMGAYGQGGAAPWQQHFFVQTYGFVSDLEPLTNMSVWNAVRDWMYKSAVGILGAGGTGSYCFTDASQYAIIVAADYEWDTPNWYDDWEVVHTATFGSSPACTTTLGGTSGGDPAAAYIGYWGNLLPAIAYAAEHGATGADASWTRLTGATNWSTVENSGFDDIPIWGIIPREVVVTPPGVSTDPAITLDTPTNGETVSGSTLVVSGWALDNLATIETAISKVEVYIDGVYRADATYGTARADVCAVYPDRIGCPNVGFTYNLNTTLSSNGTHTLMLKATDSDTPTAKTATVSISINVQNGGGGSTALATLAASMAVGSWAELTTTSLSVFQQAGAAGNILDYAANAGWDPNSKKLVYCGNDHIDGNTALTGRYVVYDDATNTWTNFGAPPWAIAGRTDHGFYHHAMDEASGVLYRRAFHTGGSFWKYTVATNTWTALTTNNVMEDANTGFEVGAYFPSLGFIYGQQGDPGGGTIYRFNGTSWSKYVDNIANFDSYICVGCYMPASNVFLFGHHSTFFKMTAAGTVSSIAAPPVTFYDGGGTVGTLVPDPTSGDLIYLTTSARDLYKYVVSTNTWSAVSSTNKPNLAGYDVIGVPVSNYGVIVYVAFSGGTGHVWVYKHA